MNSSYATPPSPNPVRGFALFRGRAGQDSRSIMIGVGGVLLVHLLLWLLAPHFLTMETVTLPPRTNDAARQFEIELAPDPTEAEQKAPPKFVETNPDAPENIPDKTDNFGANNQQVAQEKPTPETETKSDRPAIDGQKEIQTAQIVSGQLLDPADRIPPAPPTPDVETPPTDAVVSPRAEQNPLSGFEKAEGENKESYASNVARFPNNPNPAPEHVEGAKDVPLVEGALGYQPAIDPKRPRPRPMVAKQQQVRPAILTDNKFGTSNIGPVAFDARWSNYGAYLQRMIEAVQIQWERILMGSKVYPPSGTMVTVKFIINSEGNVSQIVRVENKSNEQGERACISAITDRAPYGPWTDDMKAVLGEQQELTFAFYYQ